MEFQIKVAVGDQEVSFLVGTIVALVITDEQARVFNERREAEERANNAHSRKGKIHEESIQNFSPRIVLQNVAPPLGVPGMAGMAPEAIHNPAARLEYETAIRENQQIAILNWRQTLPRDFTVIYDPIKTLYGRNDSTTEPRAEVDLTRVR